MTIYLKIRMRTNYIKKIKDVKIIYKKKNISQNNLFELPQIVQTV